MNNILRSTNHHFNQHVKFLLRGHINGLAWEARKNKKKLVHAKSVKMQSQLASNKHPLQNSIRHRLLAYAFLTGKPYASVESKCAKDNKPSAQYILEIIQQLGQIWDPVTRHLVTVQLIDIQSWLSKSIS